MLCSFRYKYLTALSAFALLFQLFAPTLAMAGGSNHSLLCNPSGKISADTQEALDVLKDVLGIDETEHSAVMDCEDCVAPAYAIAAANAKASVSFNLATSFTTPSSHKFLLASPRGPPLGSRAPPFQSVT